MPFFITCDWYISILACKPVVGPHVTEQYPSLYLCGKKGTPLVTFQYHGNACVRAVLKLTNVGTPQVTFQYHWYIFSTKAVACVGAVPKLTLPPQLLNLGHAARS